MGTYAAQRSGPGDLGYGAAAGLGLAGLLLLLVRRPRREVTSPGPLVEQRDDARTPVASGR